MRKSKLLIVLSILTVLALLLSACAQAATTEAPAPTEAVKPTEAPKATDAPKPTDAPAPTETPKPVEEIKPTEAPASAGLPEGVKTILVVHLNKGLKWSDGTEVTARDLVGSYQVYWAQQAAIWGFLKDVVAKDDYTVEFWLTNPSPRSLRLVLRSNQFAPASVYAKWMDQFAKLRQDGKAADSEDTIKVLDDLYAFKPEKPVVYGPYILDPGSVTEAQLELVKNPSGYNASKIDLEKVLVYYGETTASMPLVLSDEIDYATHGYTPSDVEQILSMPNMQMIGGPTGTGPGLWFNQMVYPLDKKEVRQAFAYIIDREENALVAMGPAGAAIKYEAGFTDIAVPNWLSQDTIDQLNPYNKDWARAEELLTSVGFKKGADGIWIDDKGAPLAFELSVPADFADWLGSAENAAQQLSAFGINATVRGYPSTERPTTQKEGKYQILVDLAIYFNPPHPQTSYNYYLSAPRNKPGSADGFVGMSFPLTQTIDGETVYIPTLLSAAATGLDFEAQKPYLAKLAKIVNQELPVLALFERIATDPMNVGTRVEGWLPASDPVYQNGQGADNYIAIQFLNGTLRKSASGDGSFHTIWPYIQPPNYDLNYFTSSSLVQNLGTPSYSLMYPPLFWYMWSTGTYAPVIAESYELIK